MKSFTFTIPEEVSTQVERSSYESETSARNVAFALARSQADTTYSVAFARYWERLVKFAKQYALDKDMISEEYVKPQLVERGITTAASWTLDYETRAITVSYDETAADTPDVVTLTLECPKEYVDEVSAASTTLNAYDALENFIYRNDGANIPQNEIEKVEGKQTDAYRDFTIAKNKIERDIVQKYLTDEGITESVNWSLNYGTSVITITFVPKPKFTAPTAE